LLCGDGAVFQRANGYDPAIEDTSAWADIVIGLVEHRTTEAALVRDIRTFVIEK
jgi:hypothetical protein